MDRYEAGMLAWSRAGHDCGQLYVIKAVEGEFVYLTDGRLKPLEKPKKKKIKHIQVIRKIPAELSNMSEQTVRNEDIRRVIRRILNVESRCD